MGLAQLRQQKPKGLVVVVDDSVAFGPRVEGFAGMGNSRVKFALVVIDPEALTRFVPARIRRDLDQATDQSARGADTAIANSHCLVSGTSGPALQIRQFGGACRGVAQAIDRKRFDAFDLEPGVEGQERDKRRQIGREQVMPGKQVFDHRPGWQASLA